MSYTHTLTLQDPSPLSINLKDQGLGNMLSLRMSIGSTTLLSRGYSPYNLFAASEPGIWLDPYDLTTLFQDTAGTTPVTAPGQPVGLVLDKSKGLVLGPELVTNGDFSSGTTGWTAASSATLSVSGGSLVVTNGGTAFGYAWQGVNTVVGRTYTVEFSVTGGTSAGSLYIGTTIGGFENYNSPNRSVGVYAVRFVATATTTYIRFGLPVNTVSSTCNFDNISVRELPGNHATQATAASRPTYQVDTGGRGYLSFDGVDDFLVTPTITPGTDKVQVFAGVRKLSDATRGIIAETGSGEQTGSFFLDVNNTFTVTAWFSTGTSASQVSTGALVSPISRVFTGLGDISGDTATLRANGIQVATSSSDQGTGNYLAYPLFIGRRNGASLAFNGNLYGLIVRFGANLDANTITNTETWVNGRTGAY